MACEWTHHISYTPFLIAVCIRTHKATFINITKSKEFGVNIAAFDQNFIASIAGNNSGKTVDKISVLKELGVAFYQGNKINTLMIQGASMNAECRLVQYIEIGDHPLLIGEALTLVDGQKQPLIYHEGKYWNKGTQIKKPDEEVLTQFATVINKFRKK